MLTLGNWQTFTPQYKEKLDDLNVSDSNNLLSSALDSDNIKICTSWKIRVNGESKNII